MKYFERKRRNLLKNNYVTGAEKSVSDTDSIEIKSSSGAPFKSLEIKGLTEQIFEPDQFKKHKSYFTNLENNEYGNITGLIVIPFPSEWLGKELTFSLVEKKKTEVENFSFEVADGPALWDNSEKLDKTKTVTSSSYTHFRFAGVLETTSDYIREFWENYDVSVIGSQQDFPESTYIKNLNDNGMSVALRSPNLLQFKNRSYSRTDSDGNVLTWEMKDGIVTVNGKSNVFTVVTLDSNSFVQEVYDAGTYSYTASYYNPENPLIKGCDWLFRYADDNTSRITGYTDGRDSSIVETKTIDKPFRVGYAQLYIYSNTEYKDFKFTIGLFKGSYTGATMPPYSPSFEPTTISIPQSIEVDGSTVDLRLAHIPKLSNDYRATTAMDYLKVDRVAKRVEYIQGTSRLVLDNNSNFVYTSERPSVFSSTIKLENTVALGNSAYCDKYKYSLGVGQILSKDYGFTTDGQYYGYKTSSISIKDIRFDNVSDFKADLKENPIEIFYCLAEPITHDITNTDLGKALLSLCAPRDRDAIFEVSADLKNVPIKVSYYTTREADVVNITIRYLDDEGNDISEPRVNKTRVGSKYLIVAPHIDGYTRVSNQVYGVAEEDTEIILEYRR